MAIPQFGGTVVAHASSQARTEFIRQTYLHLAGAVIAFIAIESVLLKSSLGAAISQSLIGTRFGWLLVLGAFMLVGHVAHRWAQSSTSTGMQYAGLALYIVAESIIMLPLLYVAMAMTGGSQIVLQAGLYTALIFFGLTGTVFFMGTDFSFLRGALTVAGFAAMAVVLVSILFGFSLGSLFCGAMILLAAGYVLYETSNVLHHFPVGFHVAAALTLFASVALMFFYILRLLMSLNRR